MRLKEREREREGERGKVKEKKELAFDYSLAKSVSSLHGPWKKRGEKRSERKKWKNCYNVWRNKNVMDTQLTRDGHLIIQLSIANCRSNFALHRLMKLHFSSLKLLGVGRERKRERERKKERKRKRVSEWKLPCFTCQFTLCYQMIHLHPLLEVRWKEKNRSQVMP